MLGILSGMGLPRSAACALLAVGAVAAVGCGGDDDTTAATASSPAPSAQTAPAEPETAEAPATTSQAPAPVRSSDGPRVETIATGLEVPWDIAFLPDGRALVTERPGRVRIVPAQGGRGSVAARVPTSAQGEGGLLGVAVDPAYAQGRRFAYLFVTTASGMQVQRWRVSGSRLRRSAVVLDGIQAGPVHDSGRLRFGPDRNLYVVTGDAGRGELAQRTSSLNGKVLRLSPRQYRSRTNRPTIVSKGHRNPQGLDWQPGSRRLFVSEHGPSGDYAPSGNDEINVIRRGRNYGWPRAIGRDHDGYAAPAWLWQQTVAPSGAAFVKRGGSSWTGDLLVATLAGTSLIRLDVSGARIRDQQRLFQGRYGRLRAVVEAPDGTFWVTTQQPRRPRLPLRRRRPHPPRDPARSLTHAATPPDPLLCSAPPAAVAQLARASACHAEGRGFESLQPLVRKARESGPFGVPGERACRRSDQPVREHRVRGADEAGDVRPSDVVVGVAVLGGGGAAGVVDLAHDVPQAALGVLERPRVPRRVLLHLQRARRDAAGVGGLARRERHAALLEDLDRVRRARHVRALAHRDHAVLDERQRVALGQLVLRRARQRDVARDLPDGAVRARSARGVRAARRSRRGGRARPP